MATSPTPGANRAEENRTGWCIRKSFEAVSKQGIPSIQAEDGSKQALETWSAIPEFATAHSSLTD